MAEIAVDGAEVARLGATLAEVGAFLAAIDRVSRDEPWAFGPGRTAGAATEVLGNWERYRLLLARELAALSDGARCAGAAYLAVEAEVLDGLGGT
ncbi:MAG TPA: hypothetical protein VH915_05115 [Pedococcus sp.]|jgi:hypothetical protein